MKTKLINENFKEDWVNNLLKARGVQEEDIERLKKPSIDELLDPNLLEDMWRAAAFILGFVTNKRHIGLIIDSDVDGITSGTIIYHYLHEIDPEVNITYFFHDHKQHGLEDCWQKFIDAEVYCVIEPDAGINDKVYHDKLLEHGIFTVVLDHHEYEGGGFSKNAIYVDNQTSPNYPNKNLAGCGVTWQCCRMIDKIADTDYAFKYIDLVALGCAADVMSPLSPENRFIFDYGFSHIQDKAFKALCEKQSYSMGSKINYTSVAFYIAPLINACMRTGTAEEKLMMYKMFLHPDRVVESGKRGAKGEMVPITEECARILTNVKARQQRLIDKYLDVFEGRIAEYGLDENNIIVLQLGEEDDFESELNGLIAMKCSAAHHKPCLVLRAGSEGLSRGSMRNPNGSPVTDLKELIGSSPYTNFVAGHSSAAGCGIETKRLNDFVDWFNAQTKDLSFSENCYEVNFELTPFDNYLEDLCWDVARNDDLWGGNNPQPIISLKNFHINPAHCQFMGQKKDTIKIPIDGVNCMIFRNPELVKTWSSMNSEIVISCIGRPAINSWMGRESIQLMIDDIEWKENNTLEF